MEVTVAHEFGHQYWYGMVATNEFEEPWLDEGINSYSEVKVMGSLFGENTSVVNARTLYASDAEFERMFYLLHPDQDPIVRQGWKFATYASYGGIVYGKTATCSAHPGGEWWGRPRFVRRYASTSCAIAFSIPPGPIFSTPWKKFPDALI